jgi:hypothetical protein
VVVPPQLVNIGNVGEMENRRPSIVKKAGRNWRWAMVTQSNLHANCSQGTLGQVLLVIAAEGMVDWMVWQEEGLGLLSLLVVPMMQMMQMEQMEQREQVEQVEQVEQMEQVAP